MGHENLVTYTWLIGSAITILGIMTVAFIAAININKKNNDKKVDSALCDQKHIPIDQALEKLDKINDTVIRIEAILNGTAKRP